MNNDNIFPLQPLQRHFLPADFAITDWASLQPWFENLRDRELDSLQALQQWLADVSELEAVISEDACWRQIRMTCDTTNKAYEEAFTYFCTDIEPQMKPYGFALNQKLAASPFAQQLDPQLFFPYLRSTRNAIALYRDENVPLQADMALKAQQYGVISGAMTVTIEDKEYTLQQAAKYLQNPDRSLREMAYRKIAARRLQDTDKLNHLFDELLGIRQQIAANAGYANYRDY
ncbi:MAG: M3 family oligoendopeptidase, partial [Chitinophagia bacterium]|nr:M3 family oligoendopeptidase [Chitinophagia bacterium]